VNEYLARPIEYHVHLNRRSAPAELINIEMIFTSGDRATVAPSEVAQLPTADELVLVFGVKAEW
jgi:hypothetical protein